MRSPTRRSLLALALLPSLLLAACGDEDPAPVAEVSAAPAELTLPYPGQVRLELTWRPAAELGSEGRPTVFVHLLDAAGEIARTYDHVYPSRWEVGGEHSYPLVLYQSLLGPPLPAGDYRLTLGLYGPDGRWALDAGEETAKREYQVATVGVPELAVSEVPRLDFGDGWLALEPGQDRQVLGSRWLTGRGSIGVAAVPEPGVLTVHFEFPPSVDGEGPVYAEGAVDRRLTVTSDCDGESDELVPGPDGRPFALVSVPEEAGCTIDLQPNFHFQSGSAPVRSARLVQLFWNPTPEGQAEPAPAAGAPAAAASGESGAPG